MSDWVATTVGAVVESSATGPFGSAVSAKTFRADGFPMVRGSNLSTDLSVRLDESGMVHVDPEVAERFERSVARRGDLIFTCWGTIGQVGYIDSRATRDAYLVSNKQMRITPDRTVVDSDFLYYALAQPSSVSAMSAAAIGSSVPGFNLGQLRAWPLRLPPLEEQRRIAGALAALDLLIDHNGVLAADSEALALAYGARFMRAMAGRGTRPLSEFCAVTKGFSYRSPELVDGADTLVNLKNIGRGGAFQRRGFKPLTSDRYKPQQVLRAGDIVIAMTDLTQQREVVARPVRVPDVKVEGQMVASLDLAIVRPKDCYSREFLAVALAQPEFHAFAKNYSNGTTVLHMSARVFDDYKLPDVSPGESNELTETIAALFAQQDACMHEIEDLTRARDELLPLLMSGKVRVRANGEVA